MEKPGLLKSTITHTNDSVIISTPKTKSWPIIVLFSMLLIQNVHGVIRGLFVEEHLPLSVKIFIYTACPIIIFLLIKGMLWQLKGKKVLEIDPEKITFRKVSPLRSRKKEYDIRQIKSVKIQNDIAGHTPLTMLQLLGITDQVSIQFSYGYDTIKTLSGFGLLEAKEIQALIEARIGTT